MRRFVFNTLISLAVMLGMATGSEQSSEAIDKFNISMPDQERVASYCTMVIPSVFKPGSENGVFVNKSYPMESSIIRYNVYYNGEDVQLTNREKLEQADNSVTGTISEPEKLTKEIYQETMSEAYNTEYGEDVGFEVSNFENITIDDCPGFKIVSEYKASDDEKIHQTVYMLVSKYRVFTVTFQRAEDDDCESYFEECASTIRVH